MKYLMHGIAVWHVAGSGVWHRIVQSEQCESKSNGSLLGE